ncbi:lipocalin family protein [Cognatilysobacter terrigena]|uniref:lipocalin family protein n=1 Tax=Cognatilysobacter terrigena TaxID=2488749 RepID=UPI00105E2C45|nr:lipocalin family protein [Lysobacter terrigena]
MRTLRLLVASVLALAGCAHTPPTVTPVAQVDLQRFMGDWYVIAHIPSYPERDAYNAVESYSLRPDGRVQTHFRYRSGSFDAPVRTMDPVGTVQPGTGNAVWGMQFVWPIQAEYVIADLSPDYTLTIIARSKRDYAWIMARTPTISDAAYADAVQRLKQMGYRTDGLRRVPQRWPEKDAKAASP